VRSYDDDRFYHCILQYLSLASYCYRLMPWLNVICIKESKDWRPYLRNGKSYRHVIIPANAELKLRFVGTIPRPVGRIRFELWTFTYKHSCWKGSQNMTLISCEGFSHTSYCTHKHISHNSLQNGCICHLFDGNLGGI
jgi:hypothetical protein